MTIYGVLETSNSNDNFVNLVIRTDNDTLYNVKTSKEVKETLKPNHVYEFNCEVKEGKRTSYHLISVLDVSLMESEKRYEILQKFMAHTDHDFYYYKSKLYSYLALIDNKIIYDITKKIIDENILDFLTYQGGMRVHHAYLGGLIEHTVGMLELATAFLKIYEYLDKNYVYAGVILHDIGKIKEYTDIQNPEFALKGHLLGHVVMSAMMVDEAAISLNYKEEEEVLVLEHILLSHHGQLEFGSPKKPMTAEAILVWYIDTIDSKFSVLKDELSKIEEGSTTMPLYILDKQRIYKPHKK